jgi:hypothetical protein
MADDIARAYFVALGAHRYHPTTHAGGAWRDDELHLAPVAGLLIHHMEQWRVEHTDGSMQFSRFTFEVLGQIAKESIELSTEVIRPGRTIELIETTAVIEGRVVIRARAWLLQRTDTAQIEGNEFARLPAWDDAHTKPWLKNWNGGFIASIRARQSPQSRPGHAQAWVTSEVPLVRGEEVGSLAEFCKLLDTANGLAVREDPTVWMYPNVDLTLHLFRQPSGANVGFDTRVAFGPDGVGVTSSVVYDEDGPVGTLHQSLTIRKIPATGIASTRKTVAHTAS